jgi:hypothetical protein
VAVFGVGTVEAVVASGTVVMVVDNDDAGMTPVVVVGRGAIDERDRVRGVVANAAAAVVVAVVERGVEGGGAAMADLTGVERCNVAPRGGGVTVGAAVVEGAFDFAAGVDNSDDVSAVAVVIGVGGASNEGRLMDLTGVEYVIDGKAGAEDIREMGCEVEPTIEAEGI